MNTIARMQPYLFPYIGYWQLIQAVDTFVIYDDVNYIKGGWINRNRVLLNQTPHFATLSLERSSPFRKINEINLLSFDTNRMKFLGLIESAYKKAPYFQLVYPFIKDLINYQENNLALFLENHIRRMCDFLELDRNILMSSSIKKDNTLKSQDKVVEICQRVGANTYINAIGGQLLYSSKYFKESDVELKFLKTSSVSYKQFDKPFIANLSIIDLLMFNNKSQLKASLDAYCLITE